MKKSQLINTLWTAINSDYIDDKHEACDAALKYLVGKQGYEALCAIESRGGDAGDALSNVEDDDVEADPDMVAALIRQATRCHDL